MKKQLSFPGKFFLLFLINVVSLLLLLGCATDPVDDQPEDDVETQVVLEPAPVEDSLEEPDRAEDFVVTEELYERTFEEVEQVIQILNDLISSGEYEAWREYLTEEYIQAVTAPQNLAQLNQTTLLQRNDIVLESLEDYFRHVVVPSRQNLRLDDLEFIDDNTVQAIMMIRDRPAILYLLRRINGEWKISI